MEQPSSLLVEIANKKVKTQQGKAPKKAEQHIALFIKH